VPHVELLICAQGAAIDRFTNSLSIFEFIDEFSPPIYPIFIPKLIIVAMLTKESNEEDNYESNIIISIGETELLKQNVPLNFQGRNRLRQIFNIQFIQVPNPGTLRIRLEGDKIIGSEYLIALNPPTQSSITETQSLPT
jgi:hypothetical protein